MKNRRFTRLLAIFSIFALIFTSLPFTSDDMDAYAASAKKPARVKTLKVTLTKANTVKLKWSKTKRAKGYAVYRNGKRIARVSRSKKSYTDKTVKAGTTYKYYVKAYNTYKAKRWYNKKTGKYQSRKPAKKYRGKQKKVKLYKYGKKSPTRKVTTRKAAANPASDSGSGSKDDPGPGDSGITYADITKDASYETGADGNITLTGYSGSEANIQIPAEIDGRKVTSIADECFRGNFRLNNVIIPDGVTSIGDYAFESCTLMETVSYPATLKTIGKGAFSGCASLFRDKDLVLPDSVESIGEGAFLYCMGMGRIVLPKNLADMGQFAFAGCERATEVVFTGTSLETLPDRAFCNCAALNGALLPEGIRKIGKRAFSNSGISEVYFPASLEEVGDYAFENCDELEHSEGAEAGVIAFNSSPLKLGKKVFYGGSKEYGVLLLLPRNAEIVEDTFACSPVCTVELYGEDGDLSVTDNGSLYTDNGKTLIIAGFSGGQEVTVGSEAEKISAYAFSGIKCGKVMIPDSVQEIDEMAFYGAKIRSVEVTESVTDPESGSTDAADPITKYMSSPAGDALLEMYETDQGDPDVPGTALIRYFRPDKGTTSYELPDSVTRIEPYAFYEAGKVTVNISDNSQLEEVCRNAFTECGILNADSAEESESFFSGSVSFKAIGDKVTIDPDAFTDFMGYNELDFDGYDFGIADGSYDESDGYNVPGGRDDDQSGDEGVTDDEVLPDKEYTIESLAGNTSEFAPEKYSSFVDIDSRYGFSNWTTEYINYNKESGRIDFSKYEISDCMPYTSLYKGEEHYRAMAAALNHDEYKHNYSVKKAGDDYENMYLAMDHGLDAEFGFAQVQEDLILYSGITPQRKAEIAGLEDVSQTASTEDLINRIGGDNEYVDKAMMSTTADIDTAFSFSKASETMVIIYASKEKLDELGSICIDATASSFSEQEILIGSNARYKVLDVGTIKEKGEDVSRTYIRLELLGRKTDQ